MATAKSLLLHFAQRWNERFGETYPIVWSKNLPQLARLLKQYDPVTLRRVVDYYLTEYADEFAKRCGYSFGLFVSLLPRLLLAEQDAREKREKAAKGSSEFERLEAARAAAKLSEGGA